MLNIKDLISITKDNEEITNALQSLLEALNDRIDSEYQNRIEWLEEQNERLQADLETMEEENDLLNERIEELEEENNELSTELENIKEELEEIEDLTTQITDKIGWIK